MKNLLPRRTGALAIALAGLLASCCFAIAGADLDTALARSFKLKQPLVLLVVESGQSKADDDARALLASRTVKAASRGARIFVLDIGVSRNRAAAARFHAVETPLLLGLTPRGIVVSRDEKPLTASLLLRRIGEAVQQAPDLDAKLAALEEAAGKNTAAPAVQFDLTDFLLAHHNEAEAIPPLAALAHSQEPPPDARIRAWFDLSRAHFWIGELEKARHEARDLMATFGDVKPEARAAGEFLLGAQDAANTLRAARARTEFEAAIAAAPDSPYAKQAAKALAKLPKDQP
jgi:hypothetical protein